MAEKMGEADEELKKSLVSKSADDKTGVLLNGDASAKELLEQEENTDVEMKNADASVNEDDAKNDNTGNEENDAEIDEESNNTDDDSQMSPLTKNQNSLDQEDSHMDCDEEEIPDKNGTSNNDNDDEVNENSKISNGCNKNRPEDRSSSEKSVEENAKIEETNPLDNNVKNLTKSKDNTSSNKNNDQNDEITEKKDLVIQDNNKNNDKQKDVTIELNSEDEEESEDVLIVETPKTNGTEIIDLADSTPEKKPITNKRAETLPPRRSTRNINRSKSYVENDKEEIVPRSRKSLQQEKVSDESDIEEVLPTDPLAVNDQITVQRIPNVKKTLSDNAATIVVKDTKRLVEIASKSSGINNNTSLNHHSSGGKKEPTLVIIDTNSILSGKSRNSTSITKSIGNSNFTSVLPVALPAQGMYPANMRATITPIPVNANSKSSLINSCVLQQSTAAVAPPLLPTLTDDMFVVEAPSFIVPYVYEKPPVKILKEYVTDLKKHIQDDKKEKKDKKDDMKKKTNKGTESDISYSSDAESDEEKSDVDPKKPYSYFNSPLGSFFIDIGFNMVQEYVQADLLKQQKRKRDREQGSNPETNKTIASLMKNIELSKGNNEHFKMEIRKCEFCNFKTESKLAMAYHLETPHMKNFVYKCNFCSYEVRSPHDILFHMEAEHAVRGHLERAPAFHQCPSCPFEDNQKGKLSRHLVVCARKFKPDRNLEPPPDWEPPAKIPRMPKMRATGLNATVAAYQTLAANKGAPQQYQFLSKFHAANSAATSAINRGRGRPTLGSHSAAKSHSPVIRPQQGMIFKQQSGGGQVLVPANYQLSGNQVFQVVGSSELGGRLGSLPGMGFIPSSAQNNPLPGSVQGAQTQQQQAKKPANTPSISITPLPRGTNTSSSSSSSTPSSTSKPGDTSSKNSFVICEICDGYIKDLDQLRNHMQWIHKIKIHPKMIYNRPPLNCQKCQFRFFTDQGLERHLLGSHGLVTSSMQDAANKSKDSGRCPVCGRVYQWKLLNHVARDHSMTLKPAHLSYKCTVCTATFGMYKQFENHVYSAHSVVAKRASSTSSGAAPPAPTSKTTDLKPLKINDEITIIPQPSTKSSSANGAKESGSQQRNVAGSSKSR